MHKGSVILIIAAAVGIGSILYLLGGSAFAARETTESSYRSASAFDQHVSEAIEENPNLEKFFDDLEGLHVRYDQQDAECLRYQAHIDQYFQGAEEALNKISDSTLRAPLQLRVMAEKDTVRSLHAALSQQQEALRQLVTRADDLANSIKVLVSLKPLRTWARENQPATTGLEALAKEYQALVLECGQWTHPMPSKVALP